MNGATSGHDTAASPWLCAQCGRPVPWQRFAWGGPVLCPCGSREMRHRDSKPDRTGGGA